MRSEQEVNRAIEQYADMVLRLCMVSLKNTADAEDVFQTVFLKYATSNRRFETTDHEKAWLIRVTRNACNDLLKSFFRKHTVFLEELSEFLPQATAEQGSVLDRVISLEGKNADGIQLVQELNVTGMPYDDAMQRILLSNGLKPYLDDHSTIAITVTGGSNEAHTEQMLSRVLCRAYNIAEEKDVLYCQVDWETRRAAQSVNLCIPRYLAWQHLLETDPSVTPEDIRQIPKSEIRVLAQTKILENPCGE